MSDPYTGATTRGTPTQVLFPFTKLQPPQLADRIVVGHAVERIAAATAGHPVTLVRAPAGSGKTTALAAWAQQSDQHVAWLRCDDGDDAPPLAGEAIKAAVRRILPEFGERLESVLSHSGSATSVRHLVTALVNDLGDAPSLHLVLDDAHRISDPDTLALLDSLLDHLPPHVRVLIASRGEPPLSLARRRVQGTLAELGFDDLRLSTEAIRVALSRDEDAPDDVVDAVARASQGWPAAVRLAAARFDEHHRGDLAATIRPDLWQFLAEEVFGTQPPAVQDFLVRTSVLDELNPSLCEAVTGRADCAAVLTDLERQNLFVARYEGTDGLAWRYHDLFAAFLRDELQARADCGELKVETLHRRAAEALPPARAVPHLLAAGEHESVAVAANDMVFGSMDASVLPLVAPWVEALPPAVVEGDHRLAILLAWRDELTGRASRIITRLLPIHARLQAAGDSTAAAEVGLQLAVAHMMQREFATAGSLLDQAERAPLEAWGRTATLALRTQWHRINDDWPSASACLAESFALARAEDDPAIDQLLASAMSTYLLFADQGPRWLLEHLRWLAGRLPERSLSSTALRISVAAAALLELDIDTATSSVHRGLAESDEVGGLAWRHQEGEAVLLDLCLASADRPTVRRVLAGASERMASSPPEVALRCVYGTAAARLAWSRRDTREMDAAVAVLDDADRAEDRVARAVVEALRARLDGRGNETLAALEEAEAIQHRQRCWIGTGLPGLERATILLEHGRRSAALDAAEPTLAAAARLGPGILLAAARSNDTLLDACEAAGCHAEVIRAVRATVSGPAANSAAVSGTGETLTARELEVLERVACGHSNRQIAEELFISEVTVKSHLSRILRKLAATSRTHAVARARELHVI